MVDLNILTKEEKEELCKLIGGEKFNEGFRKFSKGFHTIKRGFRPQSLTPAESCDIAIQHMDTPFISKIMTTITTAEIEIIEKRRKKNIKSGHDKWEAELLALRGSFFAKRLDIYFKLAEQDVSEEYIGMMSWLMGKSSELAEKHKEEDRETGELRKAIIELEDSLKQAKKETEQKVKELNRIKSESSSYVKETQKLWETIDVLQTELIELEKQKARAEAELENLKSDNNKLQDELNGIADRTFPHDGLRISFCEVKEGSKGPFLYRISDIENGEIIGGTLPEIPYTYTNLYGKFLPVAGTIGVWYWKEKRNNNDYERFFIDDQEEATLRPIQVIMVSREDVISNLKEGVYLRPDCDSFIFAWTKDRNGYEGILCTRGQFEWDGNTGCLKPEVYELPMYSFTGRPFFEYNNSWFYKKFYLGKPESLMIVSNPDDIIKDLLMKRLSWSDMKQGGLARKNFKHLRMLLEKMMVPSFYEEVEKACDCTLNEAQQYVEDFVTKSEKHISGSDIANHVISEVIENHGELKAKAYKLAADKWQEENKVIIDEKERELQDFSGRIEQAREELSRLIGDKDSAEKSIMEKESFLDTLEKEVKDRMEKAQTDISSLLVDIMVQHGISSPNPAGYGKTEKKEDISLFKAGKAGDDDLITYSNLNDVIDNLVENLESAGVKMDNAKVLAHCFYSAYVNHVPLILAGPNGKDIADAVSISLTNRKAGNLDCRGDYDPDALEKCKVSEDRVVTVTNPLNHRWAPYLPDLLDAERLTLLLVPYSEELTLEMKGLYNFALPLVTDFMIHKKAAEEEYVGGELDSALIEKNKDAKINGQWKHLLKRCHTEEMTKYWMEKLLKDWFPYAKSEEEKEDNWYRFVIYSYAYATGNLDKVIQYLDGRGDNLSDETKKLFKEEDGESE